MAFLQGLRLLLHCLGFLPCPQSSLLHLLGLLGQSHTKVSIIPRAGSRHVDAEVQKFLETSQRKTAHLENPKVWADALFQSHGSWTKTYWSRVSSAHCQQMSWQPTHRRSHSFEDNLMYSNRAEEMLYSISDRLEQMGAPTPPILERGLGVF